MIYRIGAAFGVIAALWAFHLYDKSQAVSAARDGFVSELKFKAAEAEAAKYQEDLAKLAIANQDLEDSRDAMALESIEQASEIEEYQRATTINSNCLVDTGLLGRLQSK